MVVSRSGSSRSGIGPAGARVRLQSVEFRLSGKLVPDAARVCLAASFNRWDTNAHPMRKDHTGDWVTVVTLPPGVHSYLYMVDGVWYNDPGDDGREPSVWGRDYSVKVVR